MSLSIQISNLLSRLLIFLFFSFYTNAQTIEIPKDIWNYQRCISLAMNQVAKNNLDSANYYIIKASEFKEIHPHHQMYLKYMLKRCFNEQIFFLEVKSEFKQSGFSFTYQNTSYLTLVSDSIKGRIEKNVNNWKLEFLEERDLEIIKLTTKADIIDQYTKSLPVRIMLKCDLDSFMEIKRPLMRRSDSLYIMPLYNHLRMKNNLSYRNFGDTYTSFMFQSQHFYNTYSENALDTLSTFYKNCLLNFVITPDYYAHLMDRNINKVRGGGTYRFNSAYGEYSYCEPDVLYR